jgi:hypothetical protein
MRATGRWAIVVFAVGAFVIAAMTDCGGKSIGDFAPDAGTGGAAGSGASGGLGGKGGTAAVTPRIPTDHRPESPSCVGVNYSPFEPYDPNPSSTCLHHADCTAGLNGKCTSAGGSRAGTYSCVYDQCTTDADCDPGKVCYCPDSSAAGCLTIGNCQTDADCGGGSYSYCSPSRGTDCGGFHPIDGYHCHTASDSCIDNTDCQGTDYCDFDAYSGSWKCTAINSSCAIG